MSILKKICDHKLNEIKLLKNNFTEKYLLDEINRQQKPRGFCAALKKSVKLDFFVVRFDINNNTKKYIIKIRSIILAFISIFEKKQLC